MTYLLIAWAISTALTLVWSLLELRRGGREKDFS